MRRFDNIQYLRGVAAVVVLIAHALNQSLQLNTFAEKSLVSGHIGVAVFFAVSGFIMFYTTQNGALTSGEFMARRLIRIVPLYWIATFVEMGIRVFEHNPFRMDTILPSILFFPATEQPILGVGWTLNYEMFFYLAFALSLFLPRRVGLALLFLILGLLPIIGKIGQFHSQPLKTWTDIHMWAFLVGVGLGLGAQRTSARLAAWVLPAALVAPIAVLAAQPLISHSVITFVELGLGSLIVALTVFTVNVTPKRPAWLHLERLGDASYALYLTHPIVGAIVKQIIIRIPGIPVWAYPVAMIPCALGAAWLVHTLIELPVGRWLQALSRTTPKPPARLRAEHR